MSLHPSNEDSVWRYLNFYQLASILDREQVYFSALSEFADPFEGSFPADDSIEEKSEEDNELKRFRERFPRCVFANCWHINNRESAAMWGQYDDRGVAIKTDFEGSVILSPSINEVYISSMSNTLITNRNRWISSTDWMHIDINEKAINTNKN